MRSQRWRLRAAVTGAAVVALVAATGPTGSAAPPTAAETNPPATPQAAAPSTGETPLSTTDNPTAGGTKVTLITGDVVSYTPGTDGGKPAVEVTSERTALFTQLQEGEHYYVFPGDTRALVGAGKLDKMLFDVAYLARNGYADNKTNQLPVIVQYPKPSGSSRTTKSTVPGSDAKALSTKADALPATTHATGLSVVNSAAVRVAKADAATFWSSVDAPKPNSTSLDAGVAKIWLDQKVTASLDVSVPQIGAPEAWAAGYDGTGIKVAVLDTGVDDTHPDLAGRITDSKSFVDGEAVKDGHGHGTHVVSTIIGSGAASDGRYKGVAPGAEMIVGKVLNNAGQGSDSQIIAGMEWAAQSGAKVVSMSLSGCCGDGTDPMAQAVNDLSAQYGTLFVIAAGNNYTAESIGSPGTADAALTVAAVDKQDQMADFSSRGPRQGDAGLKPDIAAPGVDITAARADGTALGPIVDDKYTTISGTSMATPHVAGAAAILAQEHPNWSGEKLKDVLVSTSKDVGHGTYEQGAGRVDVPRATTQPVYATTNVDFGLLRYPHTAPVSRPLTYANDGDTPVTLNLTTNLKARFGQAPDGMLTVSPSTITVPAHGTASVDVVLDPTTSGPTTVYGGAVHAVSTDGAVTVNTAVGARKQARQVRVTMNIVDRPEATDMVYSGYSLFRLDDDPLDEPTRNLLTGPNRTESIAVNAGVYAVSSSVAWRDEDGEWNRALFTNPNVDATGDRDVTVTFDLRKAVREDVRTPKPSIPYWQVYGLNYVNDDPSRLAIYEYHLPYGANRLWSLPNTGKATHGGFTGYSTFYNGIDPVKMSIAGRGGVTLHPQYQAVNYNVLRLATKVNMLNLHGQAQLVDAGPGRPEDFARVDARGKIALLDLTEFCPPEPRPATWGSWCTIDPKSRIQNAANAGAIAVLGYGSVGRQFLLTLNEYDIHWLAPTYPVPTMGLTAKEGRMLAARLATGPVTLNVDATEYTPYYYPLSWASHDSMPAGTRTVTDRELRRTDHRIHADTAGTSASLYYSPTVQNGNFQPWSQWPYPIVRPAPFTVTTYVGPVGQDVAWSSTVYAQDYSQGRVQHLTRAGSDIQDWGEQPLVPSADRADPTVTPYVLQYCHSCRSGNTLAAQRVLTNDGSAGLPAGNFPLTPASELHLYRSDGTEIPQQDAFWSTGFGRFPSSYFELPAQRGTYRMTENYTTAAARQQYARTVQTERTFTSEQPDSGFAPDASVFTGLHCNSWNLLVPNESGQYRKIDQNPCRPTDELFLGYDFDLALDNTLPAGSKQDVTVTGFGSPYLKTQPKLTSLTLSLSYDDGKTWQQVKAKAKNDGTYTGKYTIPALSKTTGAVTVRAEATDTNGHTVKQTITRAFGLTAAPIHKGAANAL